MTKDKQKGVSQDYRTDKSSVIAGPSYYNGSIGTESKQKIAQKKLAVPDGPKKEVKMPFNSQNIGLKKSEIPQEEKPDTESQSPQKRVHINLKGNLKKSQTLQNRQLDFIGEEGERESQVASEILGPP
jgi:hypothetical protein